MKAHPAQCLLKQTHNIFGHHQIGLLEGFLEHFIRNLMFLKYQSSLSLNACYCCFTNLKLAFSYCSIEYSCFKNSFHYKFNLIFCFLLLKSTLLTKIYRIFLLLRTFRSFRVKILWFYIFRWLRNMIISILFNLM